MHTVQKENLTLCVPRQLSIEGFKHVLVSKFSAESCLISNKTKEGNVNFPLYLYPDENAEQSDILASSERTVNMDKKIRKRIENAAMGFPSPLAGEGGSAQSDETGEGFGKENPYPHPPTKTEKVDKNTPHPSATLPPSPARGEGRKKPDPVEIFDYIYGILHCPAYRETYKEFLKIDFPRITYPTSPEAFWDISAKGTKLRQLHLMQDEAIGKTPYLFAGEGDNVVDKPKFIPTKDNVGTVFINKNQYFENVPLIAWEFYIGGYQPAQKWLKDRKGRDLSFDDVRHYQKIIKILSETDRIIKTIVMDLDN